MIRALLQQLLPEVAAKTGIQLNTGVALLRTHLNAAPHLIVIDNFDTVEDKEMLLSLLQSLSAPTRFVLTSCSLKSPFSAASRSFPFTS